MRHLIATIPFMKEVNTMRKAIKENLISLLEEHNVKRIDCFPIGNTPALTNYYIDSGAFKLDTIVLHKNSNGTYIKFECSNSHTNNQFYIEDVGIERLITIYEWVKANKAKLFADAK